MRTASSGQTPKAAAALNCTHLRHPLQYVPCQMASRKTLLVAAAVALVAAAALLPAAESKTFIVGDDDGWNVGVDYVAWAKGKKFRVGDTLVFRYSEGQDVALVNEKNFKDCVTPDNAQVLTSGDDSFVLGQSGKFFFICDAEGECASGMKLAINVH